MFREWANGRSFSIGISISAYASFTLKPPWDGETADRARAGAADNRSAVGVGGEALLGQRIDVGMQIFLAVVAADGERDIAGRQGEQRAVGRGLELLRLIQEGAERVDLGGIEDAPSWTGRSD